MKRAIAINGSPTVDGCTASLLKELDIRIYDLSDGVDKARDAILNANTIVFGTPVRWFNVSALMKELIDELPEGSELDYPCDGKTAFFVAVCDEDGAQQAINQMMAPLNHMGFWIPPYACYICNKNMAERSEDQWMLKGMPELRKRLQSEQQYRLPTMPP
jgi:multimeric flavodoxin WrbA